MTKSELIKAIAKKSSLTEAQTNDVVKALTDVITEALASGDKVQLPGLFTDGLGPTQGCPSSGSPSCLRHTCRVRHTSSGPYR